jgi:hypothetical protein
MAKKQITTKPSRKKKIKYKKDMAMSRRPQTKPTPKKKAPKTKGVPC